MGSLDGLVRMVPTAENYFARSGCFKVLAAMQHSG